MKFELLDPFAAGDESCGLACRVHQTLEGPAGSPTAEPFEADIDADRASRRLTRETLLGAGLPPSR